MKLASQESDRLLFEATRDDDGRGKQFVILVAILVIPAIAALAAWRFGWRQQLTSGEQLVVGAAIVATLAALLLATLNSFPYLASLAVDRSSRQALCVWKTLCGSQHELCDFGEFRQVAVEIVMLRNNEFFSALRLVRARGRTIVLPLQELRNLPGKDAAEALAARLRDTLALAPQSAEKIHASPFEERSLQGLLIAISIFLIGLGAALGCYGVELVQAASWPKTAGVVESVRIVQRQRRKYVIVDAVEIVYRYTVDRIVRRG
ncbi:MAG TPA: hypothetical protein VHY20_13860, partial [Pirellulales bacterium]|nr:hypothetical protein [Pirellulales bacterium]